MNLDYENLKMESIDGERKVEKEITAYALVPDFRFLDEALEHETHEQWFIDYEGSKVRGRIRKINNRRHVETIKQPLKGDSGCYECEQDISPDMFEMKKLACTKGYFKERYTFPVEGSKHGWEIDVFKSKAGGRSHWVKIDLEFDNHLGELPELPFVVEHMVISERIMTQSMEDFIKNIWENEWLQLDHQSASGDY